MIDDIDKLIIKELVNDSRVSSRELSRRIKISIGTVLSRIKKLETDGVIKQYSAILNHELIGYEITAIIGMIVAKGKLIEMEEKVGKMQETCAVYDVTGNIDALVIAKFKNRNDLSKFTKTLLSLPFVERTDTHVVFETVKEDFYKLT